MGHTIVKEGPQKIEERWKILSNLVSKQNRNFRPKGEGRSGRRPLLPKRKLNILVDLTLGKSYHAVVTFLHAQKIKCYTFSIQTSSKLISYYAHGKLDLRFSIFH